MRLRNIPGAKDAILENRYVVQEPKNTKRKVESVFFEGTACSYRGWNGKRPVFDGHGKTSPGH